MFSFQIVYEQITDNQDKVYHIQIPAPQMIYFGYIVESLEGWAFHTLLDSKQSIMYVEVVKDYICDFEILLKRMKDYDKIHSNL